MKKCFYPDEVGQCRALFERRDHTTLSQKEERACWQRIRQRVATLYVMAIESGWSSPQIIYALDEMTLDENEHIIIEVYMPFTWSIARKIWRHPLSFSDLFQEGIMGLTRAMRRYDYHKGVKFSTYAMNWVHAEIVRFLDNRARTIRIPVHQMEYLKRCWRQGDERPFQEITQTIISEDAQENEGDFIECLSDPFAKSPENIVFENERISCMREQIAFLKDPLDREVVRLLYGINKESIAYTYREVGSRLGVTHTRVEQRMKRALRQLRENKKIAELL